MVGVVRPELSNQAMLKWCADAEYYDVITMMKVLMEAPEVVVIIVFVVGTSDNCSIQRPTELRIEPL